MCLSALVYRLVSHRRYKETRKIQKEAQSCMKSVRFVSSMRLDLVGRSRLAMPQFNLDYLIFILLAIAVWPMFLDHYLLTGGIICEPPQTDTSLVT